MEQRRTIYLFTFLAMHSLLLRSLKFIIFFLIFFVVVNSLYVVLISVTDFDVKKRIESLTFKDPDYDLIVLGASTSLDGIDTEYLTFNGIKSYNMAISGASIKTNVIQLNEYIKKYDKHPKIVLFGLNSQLVKSFDENAVNPIVDVTMEGHKYNLDDVPLIRFKWLGKEFLKKILSRDIRKAKLVDGQLKLRKSSNDRTTHKELLLPLEKFTSSFWLGGLAEVCSINNIALILIEMPGFKDTQNLSGQGPYLLTFQNGYQAILYNFNHIEFCSIFDAEEDWIGNSHLNEFGATKFTEKLLPFLRALFINY